MRGCERGGEPRCARPELTFLPWLAASLIADNYVMHKHPVVQDVAHQVFALPHALHADLTLSGMTVIGEYSESIPWGIAARIGTDLRRESGNYQMVGRGYVCSRWIVCCYREDFSASALIFLGQDDQGRFMRPFVLYATDFENKDSFNLPGITGF